MSLVLEAGSQRHHVRLTQLDEGRWRCLVDDVEYVVEALPLAQGQTLLRHEGRQHLAHTARHDRVVHVHVDGSTYTLTHSAQRARRAMPQGEADLVAQMPGQVTEVRVSVGDAAHKGMVLLVMEAMKMEIRVTAPYAGVVRAVHVQRGQLVQRGQRLADVQPHQGD